MVLLNPGFAMNNLMIGGIANAID